jgi:hypothetical protein
MVIPRRVAVLVAICVLGVAASSVASASVVSRTDRKGDAPAAADIVAVHYSNTDRYAVQRVKIADLQRDSELNLLVGRADRSDLYLARVWRHKGALHSKVFSLAIETPGAVMPCRNRKAGWYPQRNLVTLAIPHKCLDIPSRRLFMQAEARRQRDTGEDTPFDRARSAIVRRG